MFTKRIQTIVPMRVEELDIDTKHTQKYLGGVMKARCFGEQIKRTASEGVTSLSKP